MRRRTLEISYCSHNYRPRTKYEGRLSFDTCLSIHPSVCLSTPGDRGTLSRSSQGDTPARSSWGVPLPGGYPGQVQLRGTPPQVPPIGPGWGYPIRGYPARSSWGVPNQVQPGGTPARGYPDRGTPPLVPPSHQTWLGIL